mmetsp:Transcript_11000/g.41072  ORF Transcript_11000/g.41072 Transcript_11000/m.41072 type:complete len:263 (+) Transcript_11000:3667-4455(+)|eukprot:scaffold1307_cov200-Pinguiococcus_pyrenoidosus.AAC.118
MLATAKAHLDAIGDSTLRTCAPSMSSSACWAHVIPFRSRSRTKKSCDASWGLLRPQQYKKSCVEVCLGPVNSSRRRNLQPAACSRRGKLSLMSSSSQRPLAGRHRSTSPLRRLDGSAPLAVLGTSPKPPTTRTASSPDASLTRSATWPQRRKLPGASRPENASCLGFTTSQKAGANASLAALKSSCVRLAFLSKAALQRQTMATTASSGTRQPDRITGAAMMSLVVRIATRFLAALGTIPDSRKPCEIASFSSLFAEANVRH